MSTFVAFFIAAIGGCVTKARLLLLFLPVSQVLMTAMFGVYSTLLVLRSGEFMSSSQIHFPPLRVPIQEKKTYNFDSFITKHLLYPKNKDV